MCSESVGGDQQWRHPLGTCSLCKLLFSAPIPLHQRILGNREQQYKLHQASFHDCEIYLVLKITGLEKLERSNGLGKKTIRR